MNSWSCSSLLALREGDLELLGCDQCFRSRAQPREVSAAPAPEETLIPLQEEHPRVRMAQQRFLLLNHQIKKTLLLHSGVDFPGCFSSRSPRAPRGDLPVGSGVCSSALLLSAAPCVLPALQGVTNRAVLLRNAR